MDRLIGDELLLDNDLYKFSMMNAVLCHYEGTPVRYKLFNRGDTLFSASTASMLREHVDAMGGYSLSEGALDWLRATCPYFTDELFQYLSTYTLDPSEVRLTYDDNLGIEVEGAWESAIMWEVPLMAVLSELHFRDTQVDYSEFRANTVLKRELLQRHGCMHADFSTRRRFARRSQDEAVDALRHSECFLGTSNVRLARSRNLNPIGTMAHEWVMGLSAILGLRHVNTKALEAWQDVFGSSLGIALTDTYTTDAFLREFNKELAESRDGVRQDSGDPHAYLAKLVAHYQSLGIDPNTKTIIFSDGLSVSKAVAIKLACDSAGIKCGFGIGTHFSNDFEDVTPLNIVIKLVMCDGKPVAKLSDDPGKVTGDNAQAIQDAQDSIRV